MRYIHGRDSSRRLHAPAAFLVGLLPCLATAQSGAVVIPAECTTRDGSGATVGFAAGYEARRQLVLDARHLSGHDGRLIRSLAFRQEADQVPAVSGRLWLEVWMASARLGADAVSPAFADNRGADHVQVFQGYVAFPGGKAMSTPAPWNPALPLTVPFRYRGGPLCLEVVTKLASGNDVPQPPSWFSFDAEVGTPASTTNRYGKSCLPTMVASASGERLVAGTAGSFHLTGPARTAAQLGLFMLGSNATSVSLQPVAPGCTLLVQLDWIFPTALQTVREAAGGSFELPIPVQRSLQGITLYTQWAVVDLQANRLGLRFSDAWSARIGAASGLGCAWLESADLAATTGRIDTFFLPVMRMETSQ